MLENNLYILFETVMLWLFSSEEVINSKFCWFVIIDLSLIQQDSLVRQ